MAVLEQLGTQGSYPHSNSKFVESVIFYIQQIINIM